MADSTTAMNKPAGTGGGSASITSTAFNLFSCIVGVGVLTVPQAVSQAGIALSLLMFALVILCVVYTTQMLIQLSHSYKVTSYEDLTTKVLGRGGYISLCIMCIILNGGAVLTYVVAMVQCVKYELSKQQWWSMLPQMVVGLWCLLVCLPLSLMPDWENLAILSKIKMVVFGVITVYILVQGYLEIKNGYKTFDGEKSEPINTFHKFITRRETWVNDQWYQSIGIILFSIVCHDSIFPLYNSMRSKSVKSFKQMTLLGLSMALLFNITIGVFTFLIFRENIPDNVLSSEKDKALFRVDQTLFLIARLLFFAVITLTLPVCVALAREYLVSLWMECMKIIRGNGDNNDSTSKQNGDDPTNTNELCNDDPNQLELSDEDHTQTASVTQDYDDDEGQMEGERPTTVEEAGVIDSSITEEDPNQKTTAVTVSVNPNNDDSSSSSMKCSWIRKYFGLSTLEYIMTFVVFFASLIGGLAVGDQLDAVVGAIGSYCAGFLGFILPGFIYLYFAYTRKYGGFLCVFTGNVSASNMSDTQINGDDVELGQYDSPITKEEPTSMNRCNDFVALKTASQRTMAFFDLLIALVITVIGFGLWGNQTWELCR